MENKKDHEIVRVIPSEDPENSWQPFVGEETQKLLEKLREDINNTEDIAGIKADSLSILSRCVKPKTSIGSKTGLVIGYVQSGKTVSFTMLSTLARDNGYKIVIIITGSSVNLYEQTVDRLKDDLSLERSQDRQWRFIENPKPNTPHDTQVIAQSIQEAELPEGLKNQTIVIAVMKNATHL